MVLLFVILVILACAILSLIVLVQNPKGGGLAGNIAGFSNQFMVLSKQQMYWKKVHGFLLLW